MLRQQGGHGHAVARRVAQIQPRKLPQPGQALPPQRLAQAQLLQHLAALPVAEFGHGVLPQKGGDGVAGHQQRQREVQAQQREHGQRVGGQARGQACRARSGFRGGFRSGVGGGGQAHCVNISLFSGSGTPKAKPPGVNQGQKRGPQAAAHSGEYR